MASISIWVRIFGEVILNFQNASVRSQVLRTEMRTISPPKKQLADRLERRNSNRITLHSCSSIYFKLLSFLISVNWLCCAVGFFFLLFLLLPLSLLTKHIDLSFYWRKRFVFHTESAQISCHFHVRCYWAFTLSQICKISCDYGCFEAGFV